MKKTILIGLISGIAGIVIGYKFPKDKNVGYVMISGRITNSEQAGKYFAEVNNVVVKGCGAKTLTVDYQTDVREGYDGPFSVLAQFPSKKAAQDCYEGDYQKIIPLRKGAIDMNFRIVERNR
ncbi:DUF1330 domain-containing protein [Prochlorococcus sp. AH-736-K15]|nr:DUF1330 domain-containing protein [Prochlorococcus sp. AH-736-K15]